MDKPRIITLQELRAEIRRYGITKLARELGYTRKHVQRIAGGQRPPGKKFLEAMHYMPILRFVDVMPISQQKDAKLGRVVSE